MLILNIYLTRKGKGNKQKLDSFVAPKTLEEEPETVDYSLPMPPTVDLGHMVSVLKGFMNVWEQHERLSVHERRQSGYNVQTEAKVASTCS